MSFDNLTRVEAQLDLEKGRAELTKIRAGLDQGLADMDSILHRLERHSRTLDLQRARVDEALTLSDRYLALLGVPS